METESYLVTKVFGDDQNPVLITCSEEQCPYCQAAIMMIKFDFVGQFAFLSIGGHIHQITYLGDSKFKCECSSLDKAKWIMQQQLELSN